MVDLAAASLDVLQLLQALLSGLGSDLGPHEVVTLVRQLGADRQGLLVEQLLVALGLAPPPPPQDVQPQGDQVSSWRPPCWILLS